MLDNLENSQSNQTSTNQLNLLTQILNFGVGDSQIGNLSNEDFNQDIMEAFINIFNNNNFIISNNTTLENNGLDPATTLLSILEMNKNNEKFAEQFSESLMTLMNASNIDSTTMPMEWLANKLINNTQTQTTIKTTNNEHLLATSSKLSITNNNINENNNQNLNNTNKSVEIQSSISTKNSR